MKDNKFTYRPFNGLFYGIFALYTLVYVLAAILQRNCTVEFKKGLLLVICVLTIIYYFIYKFNLSRDKEYDELYYSKVGGFTWWYELPMHLCNINMFMVPLALLTGNRYIAGFAFFIGPIGTAMAIMMPSDSFNNFSIFKQRMMGYYLTHFTIMYNCFALALLGFYLPVYSDIIPIALFGIGLSFLIFLFNMLLRKTGKAIKANYFYTVDPEENKVLQLFNKLIPYPYLYLIPVFLLILPYMYLLTFIINLFV